MKQERKYRRGNHLRSDRRSYIKSVLANRSRARKPVTLPRLAVLEGTDFQQDGDSIQFKKAKDGAI